MKLSIREITIFGMLGGIMYASKLIMDVFPNIHLLGTYTIAITLVYRQKALYPIYVFVLLVGLFSGFPTWWVPYLYLWLVLWAVTMLLPRRPLHKIVYMIVCAVHGLFYGILYAPAQALLFGLDFRGMLAWIVAGFPFDVIHGISNFLCGVLTIPLANLIIKAEKYKY